MLFLLWKLAIFTLRYVFLLTAQHNYPPTPVRNASEFWHQNVWLAIITLLKQPTPLPLRLYFHLLFCHDLATERILKMPSFIGFINPHINALDSLMTCACSMVHATSRLYMASKGGYLKKALDSWSVESSRRLSVKDNPGKIHWSFSDISNAIYDYWHSMWIFIYSTLKDSFFETRKAIRELTVLFPYTWKRCRLSQGM